MKSQGASFRYWQLRIACIAPWSRLETFLLHVDQADGLRKGEAASLKALAYLKYSMYDDAFEQFKEALNGANLQASEEARVMISRWPTFLDALLLRHVVLGGAARPNVQKQ